MASRCDVLDIKKEKEIMSMSKQRLVLIKIILEDSEIPAEERESLRMLLQ